MMSQFAVLLVMFLFGVATSQAQDYVPLPNDADRGEYSNTLSYEFDVAKGGTVEDKKKAVKAIETKAVAILKAKSKLTTAEAQLVLRDEQGNTNIRKCVDYIVRDQLSKITQIKIVANTIEYKAM